MEEGEAKVNASETMVKTYHYGAIELGSIKWTPSTYNLRSGGVG